MSDVNGYRVEPIEPRDLDDTEVRAAARLTQEREHEWVAEDPLVPIEVIADRMRAPMPGRERRFYAVRTDAGEPVGYGLVARELRDPANAHMRWTEVFILPEHRRRGLGRAMLRTLVESCAREGDDIVFMGQTTDRVAPGGAFARTIGFEPGLEMRTNQLELSQVDRAKVGEWARIDPAGYRLERADDVVPASLVAPYISAANAMNDAPIGTMAWRDEKFSEQQLRDREAFFTGAGIKWRLIVAIAGDTNEGAGFTEVQHDPRVPHLIWQGGTGVARGHRGHRLGLWMKAVMLQRVLAEWPAARFIRTGNANTNQWMLAINTQLGFRHAWQTTMWQMPVADARRALGLVAHEVARP